MVLEDITKEVNDAESNAENQKNSLSGGTILGKASDRQSAYCPKKSGVDTDDSSLVSLATTVPRRRARLSFDSIGRLSGERQKQRRRGLSPSIDAVNENASPFESKGVFGLLAAVEENEREFEDGYRVVTCTSLEDNELAIIHNRCRQACCDLGILKALNCDANDNLKGALLKFLDTAVGYILYVQSPSSIGTTSRTPLDRLVSLWIIPSYQNRGLERKLLHWWLRDAVRSVKFFSVRASSRDVQSIIQNEGFKIPKAQTDELQSYIAMT